MPGRPSSAATPAVFRVTPPPLPPLGGVEPGTTAPAAAGTPTATCWPSATTAARLTEAGSASGSSPPAALIASATRAPEVRVTSPGLATSPTTETTTVVEVSATSPTGGDATAVGDGAGS